MINLKKKFSFRVNRPYFSNANHREDKVSKYERIVMARIYNGEPRWKARSRARQSKARHKVRPGKTREKAWLSLLFLSPLFLSFSRVRGKVASAVATAVSQPFRGYVTLKKLFGVNTPRYSDTCSTSWSLCPPAPPLQSSTPRLTRRQPSPSSPPTPSRAQAVTPLLSLLFPPFCSPNLKYPFSHPSF